MTDIKNIKINLNVPKELLKQFDEIVKWRFTSRTELIKFLMLQAIEEERKLPF
ncbi:MAG: ribbon-helix-helix domain-containing protein [Nitrososphaeria archaeon]